MYATLSSQGSKSRAPVSPQLSTRNEARLQSVPFVVPVPRIALPASPKAPRSHPSPRRPVPFSNLSAARLCAAGWGDAFYISGLPDGPLYSLSPYARVSLHVSRGAPLPYSTWTSLVLCLASSRPALEAARPPLRRAHHAPRGSVCDFRPTLRPLAD